MADGTHPFLVRVDPKFTLWKNSTEPFRTSHFHVSLPYSGYQRVSDKVGNKLGSLLRMYPTARLSSNTLLMGKVTLNSLCSEVSSSFTLDDKKKNTHRPTDLFRVSELKLLIETGPRRTKKIGVILGGSPEHCTASLLSLHSTLNV